MSVFSGNIVNEGRVFCGCIRVEGDTIADIVETGAGPAPGGIYILPGVVDEHVHFREPGLTDKGDIASESRAAAAGGVTSFFDMPNTRPQTTSVAALHDKLAVASENSVINYGCFIGAAADNAAELRAADCGMVPGIKLFMGASTGNMLVDDDAALDAIFALAAERGLPVIAHCEDSAMIACNEDRIHRRYGDDADVRFHTVMRDRDVCLSSTRKAVALAERHGTRLMVAHVSTADELDVIASAHGGCVAAETCISYLTFCSEDYDRLGALVKCNPAIKEKSDRLALRQALTDGRIYSIATDHAPHLPVSKRGGAFTAASGMPSVQFSLVLLLQLAEEGWLTLPDVARLTSHNPARFFGVEGRGFLRTGMKADLAIVRRLDKPHTISDSEVMSKCGWTPYAGMKTMWQVESTICNGVSVYRSGLGVDDTVKAARQISFCHGYGANI